MFWEVPVCELDPQDYLQPEAIADFETIYTRAAPFSSQESLLACLAKMGIETDAESLEERFRQLDLSLEAGISFEAFLILIIQLSEKRVSVRLIDYREYLRKSKIDEYDVLYRRCDVNDTGLTVNDLGQLFRHLYINLSDNLLQEIFNEADTDGSGLIDFPEFSSLLVKATGAKKIPVLLEYFTAERLQSLRASFNPENGDFPEICAKVIKDEKLKRFRRVRPCSEAFASKLREEGMHAIELKAAGYEFQSLRNAGYSVSDCVDAGYDIKGLIDSGVTIAQLRSASVGPMRLIKCGADALSLRQAGYSAESIRRACKANSN